MPSKIKNAAIAAHAEHLAAQLNASTPGTCGRSGEWHVGESHDVTTTGGCLGLGLKIPLIEHDLLKMESSRPRGSDLLLYLGQTHTTSSDVNRRPTSYQPGLVRCAPGSSSPEVEVEVPAVTAVVNDDVFPLVQVAQLTQRRNDAPNDKRISGFLAAFALTATFISL